MFGIDSELKTGKLVKKYGGTKVLVHYGGGSVVRSGLLDRVCKSLDLTREDMVNIYKMAK